MGHAPNGRTYGEWRVQPTTKRAKKFWAVRDVLNDKGEWCGLDWIFHANGGVRHFSSAMEAREAIEKATGESS